MKLGYFYYWFGWGGMVFAVVVIILGILCITGILPQDNEGIALVAMIWKACFVFVFAGPWLVYIGKRKIQKAKLEGFMKTKQQGFAGDLGQWAQLEQVGTFQKANCVGCRFADEEAMRSGQKWCTRSEPPEFSKDSEWCYSREVTKG